MVRLRLGIIRIVGDADAWCDRRNSVAIPVACIFRRPVSFVWNRNARTRGTSSKGDLRGDRHHGDPDVFRVCGSKHRSVGAIHHSSSMRRRRVDLVLIQALVSRGFVSRQIRVRTHTSQWTSFIVQSFYLDCLGVVVFHLPRLSKGKFHGDERN